MDIEPPELQPSRSPVKRSSATFLYGQLTNRIIGCATQVHKELGPGLLEALYEEAFCAELSFSAAITQIRRLLRERTEQQGGRETGEQGCGLTRPSVRAGEGPAQVAASHGPGI